MFNFQPQSKRACKSNCTLSDTLLFIVPQLLSQDTYPMFNFQPQSKRACKSNCTLSDTLLI
jgi:hypothetical protein